MSELAGALADFAAVMANRGFPVGLYAPATSAEIAATEAKIGQKFPAQLRELYLLGNGSAGGLILSYPLYTLGRLEAEYAGWHDLIYGSGGMEQDSLDEDLYASVPPKTVQLRYWIPGWIPLCGDEQGNHVVCDLDPAEAGTAGQLVTMGADEDTHQQLAPSLSDFLRLSTRLVAENALSLTDTGQWETERYRNPFWAFYEGRQRLSAP